MRGSRLESTGAWRLPWLPDGTPCVVSMDEDGFVVTGQPPCGQCARIEKAAVSSVEVARTEEAVGERATASFGVSSLLGLIGGPLAFAGWVVGTTRIVPVTKPAWWLIIGFADGSSAAFGLASGSMAWGAPRRVAERFARDFRRHRERYAEG